MATSITMPQLGESVTEGTIGRWLKQVGETVARDEPLVEVITDKVNVEVPSPEDGVVGRIVVEEGKTVPVGTEICVLEAPGFTAPSAPREPSAVAQPEPPGVSAETGGPTPATPSSNGPSAGVSDAPAPPPASAPAPEPASHGAAERHPQPSSDLAVADVPRTSPLVRRLAREHDVDLASIPGSGLGGRVTRDDIEAFIAARGGTIAAPPEPPPAARAPATAPAPAAAAARPTTAPAGWQVLTPMRRAIGEHMVRSVSTAPHVTTCFEFDLTDLMRLREHSAPEFERREGFRPSPLAFVAKAVVESLREHPLLNSSFDAENGQPGIRQHGDVNLGVAVGLDHGLMVPVIRNADALSIAGLARAVHDLVGRARAGKLGPEDMRGGTFTLNNTGAFGSVLSTPILNQGQAAIMTMEAVVRRPVVVERDGEESIAIRSMMFACLTFDHRVLDGLQAGRFMQSVKKRLEATSSATTIY
jgi:pyruvate/2-oxoglutarate dehydrogenase complex dihydrolipoamide acyltransferase (E2) component